MKTPREVYAAYKIMPTLQLHQLRVAAVAQLICSSLNTEINERDVILACLFHDMGNIIKSDFSAFPDFCEPEGVAHWQGLKDEFVTKYGKEAHAANVSIAREIGLPESVAALIDGIKYSEMQTIIAGSSWERKITEYADTRVGPYGVLAQLERISEGKRRYDAGKVDGPRRYYSGSDFQNLLEVAQKLEDQIFSQLSIAPTDINDASIAPFVEKLWEFPVA